jgi:hypothetical protein
MALLVCMFDGRGQAQKVLLCSTFRDFPKIRQHRHRAKAENAFDIGAYIHAPIQLVSDYCRKQPEE